MISGLSAIFPCDEIEKTCDFYVEKLGFRAVKYLGVTEPHICLYKDDAEIILTHAVKNKFVPIRIQYGYGYDAYFYTADQENLQKEFMDKNVKIIKTVNVTDYDNKEFVIEDCDGRYIAFGCK